MSTTQQLRSIGIWLLVLSLMVAGFAALINGGEDPTITLQIFSTRFLGIFIEAVPFLLMGSFVSGLLEVFVTREDIVRWIPRNPILATIAGAFMGFAFPVCECGVVPVTRRLFSKGLPMSVGVAFLLAAPVMNPIVLVSTYIAFGWGEVLILRFVITAVVAIGVGALFAVSARPYDILRPVSLAPIYGGDHRQRDVEIALHTPPPLLRRLERATLVAGNEFFEMGRFLVVGSLLAAGMQTVVAQETLISLGSGPLISVLVMQLLAFVLSVCSTVDSFLALAFYGTFTGGSIVAFLTFGPMVDIKSTMMFAGVFRPKVVLYLVVLPFLMTMLIGLWLNLFMSF